MVQLNRRWAPHRSKDNPSNITCPLWHSLSTYISFLTILPIYSPAIRYCYNGTAGLGSPPVTRQPPKSIRNPLFTLPLPHISSSPNCHSLSTLPLYSSSLPPLHSPFLLTGQKTIPHMTKPPFDTLSELHIKVRLSCSLLLWNFLKMCFILLLYHSSKIDPPCIFVWCFLMLACFALMWQTLAA